jgi:hypothetical protein
MSVSRPKGQWRTTRVVVLAITLLLIAGGTPAGAGTYEVVACDGGPDNSWADYADPGMAAYQLCPNNPRDMISGIIARASVGSGGVGYLQGAYQVFSAPSGASLVHMTFTVSPWRWEQYWSVGIVAFDADFNSGDLPWGCYAGRAGCGIVPGAFYRVPNPVPLFGHTQVRIESRCGNPSGCTLASTGHWPYTRASMSIANVRVLVQDYTQPGLAVTGGGLTSGRWLRGVQGLSFDAADNVGIRETRLRVDGHEVGARGKPCDYTLRAPCPQGGDGYAIDTATIRPDGPHTVTAEVVDTASNVAQANVPVLIDNSPPAQPEAVAVDGGQGWHARNDFRLTWRNPVDDDGAPVTGAVYEICPVGGGECGRGSQDTSDTAIGGFKVPEPGEYVARLWLRDDAGNEDPKTAGAPVRLRFDDEAPEVSFEQQNAADPTRVALRASDKGSGVAGGEIELRLRGSRAWHSLSTQVLGGHLVAHLDDESLPDGAYELRGRAYDRAGNERSTDRNVEGGKAEVVMPVRVKTYLRVGVVRHRESKRGRGRSKRAGERLSARARVGFGRRMRIRGQLTDASRAPITDAQIHITQAPRSERAAFGPVVNVRTSGSGRFSYLAPAGASRSIRFRYPGAATVRPATQEVKLLVRASTTMKVSQRFALNGETVAFSGRLRGRPLPTGGKLVELQAYVRGRWRTFVTTRAGSGGDWRYDYRFDGTRGRQVYRFRARVPREGTYPYEAGSSRRVRVTVVGL